jgi:hypothetical protein
MESMMLDPRIGKLNSGLFYCYPKGHGKPELTGTLEEVEAALGLCPATVITPEAVAKDARMWSVTMRFQYPSWDEIDGIVYRDIRAESKAEANARARRMAADDGHLHGGKGRVTFSATEQ